ncbi:class I SAM-dependent methyltransferase [Roseofilum sp. BLCC_M154]|uniref:Class I SAM-dependent methyltransferase n=1 Tax=Roseofilum acuticapitatum BLCC-M154 TaxID=3022444 RepID=A0ABT7AZK7_9CYAN|nr:class I SAM-dependent methyltransferase [Roseofilum acuticapitatum]MDJ1172336.1 class I SAM-dependent methyltransferase [Roseofilum acuticapitatum BLCC-M154]
MTKAGLTANLVNRILSIKPLASIAKHQARQMIVKRAEKNGIPWRAEVKILQTLDWTPRLEAIQNPNITYPDYYLQPFHAYDRGNLSWEAALEVEFAAKGVHAQLWKDAGAKGDERLRQTYHQILLEKLTPAPQDILDVGCSIGMSTFALQDTYPNATVTGLDLSPYFLAVAGYRAEQRQSQHKTPNHWIHARAEETGLPDASFDLVSLFLICHELPQAATRQIFREARRILRPQGHLAIMEMNPQSEVYKKMPPYVFTLLKSTEPYMDEYFTLDIAQALVEAGFKTPLIQPNTIRHRTIIAPCA